MQFLGFPVLPGSAEAQAIWGGTVKCLLIAYFIGNLSAKKYQNGDFLRPAFPASCTQHISDLHSKFAVGPHHVLKYGRHPICDG